MRRTLCILSALLSLSVLTVVTTGSHSVKVDWVTTVGRVIDGDTFDTANGTRIRFADIDAPEYWEEGYNESKDYLTSLFTGTVVYIDIDDISRNDSYGRLICLVLIEENVTHFVNVNEVLVITGNATIDNYTNNEFDPYAWSLYYPKDDVTIVSEFTSWAIALICMFGVALLQIYKSCPRGRNKTFLQQSTV